jgi:type I restriction enzyme, S subunit
MKWEKSRLNDIVKLTKGKKHTEVEYPVGYRYLQIEDLHGTGINKYTNDQGVECITSDILIAWDGANAGKVGTGLQGMAGSTLARIRIISDRVSSRYLYWYLFSNFEVIKSKRTGATIPHVNGSELRSMEVPLPPLHIQEQIADTLDKADTLRKKDQELSKKYDELAKSIFYKMFGDPVKNERGWSVQQLEELVTLSGGGTPKTTNEEYYNGNIPWISPKDMKSIFISDSKDKITELAVRESSTKMIEPYSVLMVVRSGILKNTLPLAINTKPVALNQDMKSLRCREGLNPYYLLFQLKSLSRVILSSVRGTTADNISSDVIKKISLIVAPTDMQNHFERLVLHTYRQLELQIENTNKSNILSQQLQYTYFP